MKKQVARIFHFPPSELSLLYIDDQDDKGLIFWYDDACEYIKEMKAASNPKKAN